MFIRAIALMSLFLVRAATAAGTPVLEQAIQRMDTSTLLEWTQNLEQTCAGNACQGILTAERTTQLLSSELRSRFEEEAGDSLDSIPLSRWVTLMESRSDGERCRLLRTAFVLSLTEGVDPSRPVWRLFTHERPLAVLSRLGHRSSPGTPPLCPDYFFPESDVLEQAITRGERLFQVTPLTPGEAASRIRSLENRYLSRGSLNRSPAG